MTTDPDPIGCLAWLFWMLMILVLVAVATQDPSWWGTTP